MRANGLINFVIVTSATACLMGVVTKNNPDKAIREQDFEYTRSKFVQPPDTPDTQDDRPDLHYKFKDADGNRPLTEPKSKLYLDQPENVKTDVQYDPKSGNYNIKQKVGSSFNFRPETYMSLKEYKDYVYRKQLREYWRSRVAADELNNKPRKGMIPKLQVNSELFDRIFGGNTVDIKPTGTAELIFGLTRSKNFNPSIPQKQQKITNFDFNMRIQLSLIGKIGEKLKVTTNYNTEASFDWENQVKMDYTGLEDEILKKIEAGNVTLPLNSSLISGSQTLFGFKTEMQFGRLRATTIFSQQKGKKTEINVQGGAQTQQFTLQADGYEQNKHYFLAHYFRDHYDSWMEGLPIINSPIVINKVEVYVLSINGNAEQTRNVVAFEDLGENIKDVASNMTSNITTTTGLNVTIEDDAFDVFDSVPHNTVNTLYAIMTNSTTGILKERKIDTVSSLLSSTKVGTNLNNSGGQYMDGSRDFNILRNARRLNATEYYFHPRLGYISLNQQLNNDQALAVSYQFTYGGKTFQVGEFSDQVPENSKLIFSKLLKSSVVNVKQPMWKLMMKNVYALGAYNLNPQDFKLDVYYNNIETGVDIPYLPFGAVNGQQLIRVLGCDRLSANGDRASDGVYDFVDRYTISVTNGRAYFPTIEPFGRGLAKKFSSNDFPKANDFIYTELYDSTRITASNIQNKNRFKIKGSYRASSGSEIALNALNIPQGAVIVTANGVALVENVDYTVDYTLGRVKIINESILNSGSNIKVSLESNSLFSVQQKSLMGTRLDFRANRDLSIGGTFLRFSERPITQKVSIGDEPVNNIIAGMDFNYKSDAPFITRLLDKLPFYSTKEMSSITARGEFAKLFPGNAKAIQKNGGNSYIDDFEGSVSLIDIKGATSWFMASIPQHQPSLFPEATMSDDIAAGINRARFNWYNVDAMFTRDQGGTTPSYYSSQKLFSNNLWRQVFETELFPGKTPPNGQQVVLPLLDLVFYPSERGPYNYDVKGIQNISSGINRDGSLKNPQSRWGGIMRKLETNDFQAANVEYIQFWMMDPYNEDYSTETDSSFDHAKLPKGDLYINLGNISEDIVRDGGMVYENGIPGQSSYSSSYQVIKNNIADVPAVPPIVNAFSQDNADRPLQDVGYDGLSDENERKRFQGPITDISNGAAYDQSSPAVKNFITDPSSDTYHFFRGDDYDNAKYKTLKRYSRYNNPEGNSPTQSQYGDLNPNGGNYPTGATTIPNIEDINRDNTLSDIENYYQYHVRITPQDIMPTSVGSNFIVDAFNGTAEFSGVTKTVKWYQFKIPISQFESNVGGIEGFNSIRFMRVYMKGFDRPVVLRLARFELVRSDWRRYQYDLRTPGEYIAYDHNNTSFDVSAVSLQENSTKVPVNYVMPPDIQQQQNVQTTNLVLQNEQALQMRICDLKDGDSRAIFKNVDLDTRMFKNMKMNVHAEQLNNVPLKDGDVNLFFRVGTDYNNNFYEYEIPLKLTPKGTYDPNSVDARNIVWPPEDQVNLRFDDISLVKQLRNEKVGYYSNLNQLSTPFSHDFGGYTITIVGNPNLGTVKSIMVGVRNPKNNETGTHCVEVWVNELRLTDFNNQGGWATTGQVQAKLADLGVLSLAGTYKTPYWGSVESKINDRSRETNLIWDVSTQINAGKFFPSKLKLTLPVFYSYGQTKITPLFNPLDPDVKMDALKDISDATLVKDIRQQTIDFTERKSFNLSNVRIDGLKRAKAKPMPWDIGNFSATYAYSETDKRSVNVEYNINRVFRGNLQYAFAIRNPLVLKPFDKVKFFNKKAFAIIKDFNLQLMPNSFGASVDVNRTYAAVKNRDITSLYDTSSAFKNQALINKNFTISRNYNLMWTLSKSVKFDYTANNDGRILEPRGEVWKSDKVRRDSLVNTFLKGKRSDKGETQGRFGENTTFRQQMNLNVELPISKIPILDFIKVNYKYGGTFTWTRRPFAAADSIGNTIQNTNTQGITGSLSMMQLYNKIPYFKKINNPPSKGSNTLGGAPRALDNIKKGAKTNGKDSVNKGQQKNSNFKDIAEFLARTIMMVKNISLTAQINGGQALSNFKPSSQSMGMDFSTKQNFTDPAAPGLLFVTGQYDPYIRERSINRNWLAKNQSQTTPYTEVSSTNYSYKATVEPHGSLKIDFTGNYTMQRNKSEYIIYDPTADEKLRHGDFVIHGSPSETGNFSMSSLTIFKTFKDGRDPVNSNLFNDFLSNRRDVAISLAAHNAASRGLVTPGKDSAAYVDGYSDNQQDVLLGAFYQTYTGKGIKRYSTHNIFPNMPMPNWTIQWDGLGKIPIFKKYFRGIIVRHAYRSTYNVNSFSNNLLFNSDQHTQNVRVPVDGGGPLGQNFVPYYNVSAVTISEQYAPLAKIEFQFLKAGLSANIETKRDKTTSLNITGLQIIETKGQEYTVGFAYPIPKLRLKGIRIQGKVLESNLNTRIDFSYRKNLSVIRRLTDGISVPTGGTNIITMRSSADYMLTSNVTLRIFCDWIRTRPQTSAAFPTSNVNAGFSLRINFQ